MASVNVTNVVVLNNPATFEDPFQFEITFECVKELSADLEWKLTYVGSAESEELDQELDSVLVGPVPIGVNRFLFETPAPDPDKIPKKDLLGVTVCLISCLFKGKEFIRIGYYVNNEYDDPAAQEARPVDDGGMDISDSSEEELEEGEEGEAGGDESKAGGGEGGGKPAEEGEGGDAAPAAAAPAGDNNGAPTAAASADGAEGADKSGSKRPLAATEVENTDVQANKMRRLEEAMAPSKEGQAEGQAAKGAEGADGEADDEDDQEEEEEEEQESEEEEEEPVPTFPEKEFELPENFSIKKIRRHILFDKPRLTRFNIDWE
jgi:histone chaperone ASF1